MSVAARPVPPLRRRGPGGANLSDRVFRWGTLLFALAVAAVVARASLPALLAFGARFLASRVWDPVQIHLCATSPFEEWHRLAWAASLVLVSLVLVLSILARYVTRGRVRLVR